MKTRIQVISQGGRLVGVYVPPPPPSNPNAPVARLVPGRGQVVKELLIDVEVGALRTHKHIETFHAEVRKKLKLRK